VNTEKIVSIAKSVFEDMTADNFCSCYEGDWKRHYPIGVNQFLNKFRVMLDSADISNKRSPDGFGDNPNFESDNGDESIAY
jgi:hypothetical protein